MGSGIYFPETYIISIILKSKLLVKDDNMSKAYELALEAETLSIVEDNYSLLIDSKLAIIECLYHQKKLTGLTDKLKEVKDLIETEDITKEEKNLKLANYSNIKELIN